jgi:hypothetical protein
MRLDISSRRQRLRINIHFAMFLLVPSLPPPRPRAPANHGIPPGNRTHYAGGRRQNHIGRRVIFRFGEFGVLRRVVVRIDAMDDVEGRRPIR